VTIYRGTTAEPQYSVAPSWRVEVDVTRFILAVFFSGSVQSILQWIVYRFMSVLSSSQNGTAALGTGVNSIYNGTNYMAAQVLLRLAYILLFSFLLL